MGLRDLFKGSQIMFSVYGRESFMQWIYNDFLVIFYFWVSEEEREGHLEPGSHELPNHPDVYHLVLLWLGQGWVMNVSSCIFPHKQMFLPTDKFRKFVWLQGKGGYFSSEEKGGCLSSFLKTCLCFKTQVTNPSSSKEVPRACQLELNSVHHLLSYVLRKLHDSLGRV